MLKVAAEHARVELHRLAGVTVGGRVAVATTDQGSEVVLAMSPPIERFGLRFAAAALPEGEGPGSFRAEREGTVLETRPQPMRRHA